MGTYTIKMPDVGEGVAEAELVELNVPIGEMVREDDIFAAVMTDKATVEIPTPVSGKVIWFAGEIGDTVPVGAPLVRLEVEGEGNEGETSADGQTQVVSSALQPVAAEEPLSVTNAQAAPQPVYEVKTSPKVVAQNPKALMRAEGEKPLAAPALRKRVKDAGMDLRQIAGSGPAGRITHEDLDAHFAGGGTAAPSLASAQNHDVTDIKIVGMRRKIAERMVEAKTRIPHISIVEEIDVTSLEDLRMKLNDERGEKSKLTVLPFLMGAMVTALKEQPQLNANYDDNANIVHQFGAAHIGIATQTPKGLMVPVVRHCEALSIWQMAQELSRVTQAARDGNAKREELSGSTISITSLGKLGAIATTPIINKPELAIVGVNRMAVRPMWNGTEFVPRKMMNISCSFDHRIIDGWDAAIFVQRLKTLLETPAMIFVEG